MALPSIAVPILLGVAAVAVIASIFKMYGSLNQEHTYRDNLNGVPVHDTWSDIRSESESRRRKKPKKKCPVCLEEIEILADQDIIIFSLKCGHLICADCLKSIQNFHRTSGDCVNPRCPQCRFPFQRNEVRRIVW